MTGHCSFNLTFVFVIFLFVFEKYFFVDFSFLVFLLYMSVCEFDCLCFLIVCIHVLCTHSGRKAEQGLLSLKYFWSNVWEGGMFAGCITKCTHD